jgi:hypothetical protein
MDPSGRYVLGMQVDFEHRTPEADDIIKIGIIDLDNNDKWSEIGESRAWNWQPVCVFTPMERGDENPPGAGHRRVDHSNVYGKYGRVGSLSSE